MTMAMTHTTTDSMSGDAPKPRVYMSCSEQIHGLYPCVSFRCTREYECEYSHGDLVQRRLERQGHASGRWTVVG